ncbi:hypothetical protein CDAR_550081 [Caerostris darwini]|uniref:Uncharacterized protein n=1 Tax=Caerostris darwini TaxID=1538125 RepID=A0AAV4PHT9_9ARAC|nr:hypothetical protein CDAR_550081 [Caerostris darwini]
MTPPLTGHGQRKKCHRTPSKMDGHLGISNDGGRGGVGSGEEVLVGILDKISCHEGRKLCIVLDQTEIQPSSVRRLRGTWEYSSTPLPPAHLREGVRLGRLLDQKRRLRPQNDGYKNMKTFQRKTSKTPFTPTQCVPNPRKNLERKDLPIRID